MSLLISGGRLLLSGGGVAYVAPDDAPAEDVAPTDIVFSTNTVPYDAAEDDVLCTLSAPGATQPVTYTIVGGDDAALVYVDGAQIKRSGSGSMTADDVLDIDVQADNGVGSPHVETWAPSVVDPGAPITMAIGLRNYGASEVPAGSIIQFGVPIDQAREIDPASVTYALARDSDSEPIPVQVDLASTTRTGGHLCYAVATAKLPYALAATTTSQCTLTVTPGGTYDGGSETVSVEDLEARDFNITLTGDDVTTLAVASFNDFVYRRKIKSGSVETGWEGWSRFKEGGVAAGQWCVRWRAMGRADASLDDWRIEATIYCCSTTPATHFGSGARGRTGTFVLRAGSTVLNDHADFENVFVSGNTGFAMYAGGDSRRCAHGGATLRPVHDRDYLIASKAIWPFRFAADDPNEGATGGAPLGSYTDAYTPGSLGGFRVGWAAAGVDGLIGPMTAVSHNMLRNLSDDGFWRRGYDMGLKHLGAPIHGYDPDTGYAPPQFGSYPGLGTANNAQVQWSSVYSSADAVTARMTIDNAHYSDTAYVPGLLTGEAAFVDGCMGGVWDRRKQPNIYRCPQCTGRDRRLFPFLNPGPSVTREDDWPHRQLAHQYYLSDDGRADKAYVGAIHAQTALWVQDLYVDHLPWTSRGVGQAPAAHHAACFSGNPSDGTSGYALGLTQFNSGYSPDGWCEPTWSMDFRAYVLWLIAERNGEPYARAVYDGYFTNYMIGRALGPGTCISYSAEYAMVVMEYGETIVQDWATWWQRYRMDDVDGHVIASRSECPVAPSGAGSYIHKYLNVLGLLHRLGLSGAHGHSYADAYAAIDDACAGVLGSAGTWDESVGGRWIMERI